MQPQRFTHQSVLRRALRSCAQRARTSDLQLVCYICLCQAKKARVYGRIAVRFARLLVAAISSLPAAALFARLARARRCSNRRAAHWAEQQSERGWKTRRRTTHACDRALHTRGTASDSNYKPPKRSPSPRRAALGSGSEQHSLTATSAATTKEPCPPSARRWPRPCAPTRRR